MKTLLVLCAMASLARAEAPHLENRTVAIAGMGVMWMQIEGVTNQGMGVQPSINRTWDRFELQADYLLADLKTDAMRPGSLMHRLGVTARHQIGRVRIERTMTMDAVVEGGIGLQYIALDDGDAIGRNDFVVGVGLRTLTNVTNRSNQRALMGIEAMLRMLVTPSGDAAFVAMFGVPFGR